MKELRMRTDGNLVLLATAEARINGGAWSAPSAYVHWQTGTKTAGSYLSIGSRLRIVSPANATLWARP
jgi:hypothetical protein